MEQIYALIDPALEDAIQSINDGTDPVIPFTLILLKDGEAGINRFIADDYEKAIDRARNKIVREKENIQGYVIGWCGYVDHEGHKRDAIIIEAALLDQEHSSRYYLAYQPPSDGEQLKEISNVKIFERPNNLLK